MSVTATTVRPFRVEVPEEQLAELRRRLAATRWPSRELVADRSQGVQLATLQALTRYWAAEHDWRACEAKLNALPQFTTEIDGVAIHFIHSRNTKISSSTVTHIASSASLRRASAHATNYSEMANVKSSTSSSQATLSDYLAASSRRRAILSLR